MKIGFKNSVDNAEITIYGDIGDVDYWEDGSIVTPSSISKVLKTVENKPVVVRINSCGGDVFSGFAISNILKTHKAETTAYIDGLGASIASVIALSCDKVVMPSNAYLMVHRVSAGVFGNADEILKTADTVEKLEKDIVNIYLNKAKEGVTEEQLFEMMKEETWLNGVEAEKIFNIELDVSKTMLNYADTKLNFINKPVKIDNTAHLKERLNLFLEKERIYEEINRN